MTAKVVRDGVSTHKKNLGNTRLSAIVTTAQNVHIHLCMPCQSTVQPSTTILRRHDCTAQLTELSHHITGAAASLPDTGL